MTLRECYCEIGGDYEGVVARLMNERIVQKFLLRFLSDASYDTLVESLEAENYEEAFRAAHTLKGVCQNLGLTRLGESSSRLTEALRNKNFQDASELLDQVKKDYCQTVSAVGILKEEAGS